MSSSKTVSFIGTGIMGAPMARHIAAAGYNVKAWNRTMSKAEAIAGNGVTVCSSLTEAYSRADYIVVMLSTGEVVDEVLFNKEDGGELAIKLAQPGAIVVVMSSIPVELSRKQAKCLKSYSLRYIDAPVSGGEKGARDATLTIMAGGSAEDLEIAMPVLETLGRVTHVGPVGSGQLAKLANQTIVGITIGAVAEALLLVRAGGGDPQATLQALQGGFADSTVLRQHGIRMLEENFDPGAQAHIQLKDLTTAWQQAQQADLELPILSLLKNLYTDMCNHDLGHLDHSALILELAGQTQQAEA